MFNSDKKKDEKKAADEKEKREADKGKSVEAKAVEAKQARDELNASSANKTQAEKSFGDDQQTRYDPKDLEKANEKGAAPAQSMLEQGHDVHVNVEKKKAAQVKKDYSKDIKVGSLVYQKPKETALNVPAASTDGRPWTVMAIKEGGKANCLIQDPATNRQRTEVFELSDLMLDEPL